MKYGELFCINGYDKFPSRVIMLFLRASHIRCSFTIILSRNSRVVGKYALVLASIIVYPRSLEKVVLLNQHLL